MTPRGFALFDTAIGACGIAWSDGGIVSVQLPERSEGATRARLARKCAGARESLPPHDVQRAIDAISSLLDGEPSDLSFIRLDVEGIPEFHRRVYDVARTIPPGATLSYGDIASRLGDPGSARAVGQALGRNPFVLVVPCHRVVAAGGKTGGFSANGGTATKLTLLAIEGAQLF
jgi:O-6-methylguanine DNA methyltransferase